MFYISGSKKKKKKKKSKRKHDTDDAKTDNGEPSSKIRKVEKSGKDKSKESSDAKGTHATSYVKLLFCYFINKIIVNQFGIVTFQIKQNQMMWKQ